MSSELRKAIEASGKTLTELAKASGVDTGRLSRFIRGERDLTLSAADQLCESLGLRLVAEKAPKKKPKRPAAKKPKGEK